MNGTISLISSVTLLLAILGAFLYGRKTQRTEEKRAQAEAENEILRDEIKTSAEVDSLYTDIRKLPMRSEDNDHKA